MAPRPPLQRLALIAAQDDLHGRPTTTRPRRLLPSGVLPATTRPHHENSPPHEIIRRINLPGHSSPCLRIRPVRSDWLQSAKGGDGHCPDREESESDRRANATATSKWVGTGRPFRQVGRPEKAHDSWMRRKHHRRHRQ
jgi:hypothetical protein